MTRIVTIPYRGLRCRELTCQARITLAPTTRGRTMPLDAEPIRYGDAETDKGLFVILDLPGSSRAIAVGIRAACAELGLEELPPDSTVYAGHWGTCSKPDRFRR